MQMKESDTTNKIVSFLLFIILFFSSCFDLRSSSGEKLIGQKFFRKKGF